MSAATEARPVSPDRAAFGYATAFAGLFLALGAQLAFLQLWLEGRGLDAAEIGAVFAAATAARMAAGAALPALSDLSGRPRRAMAAIALLGAVASLGLLAAESRTAIWALVALQSAAIAGLAPVIEAHAYAEAPRRGFAFPRVRSVGSAAFIVATFGAGLVAAGVGRDAIMIWIAAAFGLAALGALAAPRPEQRTGVAPRLSGWARIATDRRFLLFLLAIGALQASHAVYYVYGSLHWSARGWSDPMIGALWSVGVVAEILLFLFAGRWLAKIPPARAMALAGVIGVLRWGALTVDPSLEATVALQILHAGTFGLAHLASLAFIAAHAPRDLAASAQGMMAAASNAAVLVATIAAAAVYPWAGAAAYWLAALCSIFGAALSLAPGLNGQPQSADDGANTRAPS